MDAHTHANVHHIYVHKYTRAHELGEKYVIYSSGGGGHLCGKGRSPACVSRPEPHIIIIIIIIYTLLSPPPPLLVESNLLQRTLGGGRHYCARALSSGILYVYIRTHKKINVNTIII